MQASPPDPADDDARSHVARPDVARSDAGRSPVDRRFAALIGDLRAADPRFARRVSEAHRWRRGHLMVLVGVVATMAFGVVPLALGIHLHAAAVIAAGAVGVAATPVLVPALVGLLLHQMRPAW